MNFLWWIALWIAGGIGGAGFFFAYFQDEWPALAKEHYRKDRRQATLWGLLLGPIGCALAFVLSGFGRHGWRLR